MDVLEAAGLSNSEMRRLFEIAMSSIAGARHGLMSKLTGVLALAELAEKRPDVARPLLLTRAAREAALIAENSLRLWWREDEDPFAAKPSEVVEVIRSTFLDARITVGGTEPVSFRLIYPAAALFVVVHELVSNALRHSGNVECLVSWQMRNRRFACSVEDSGGGISARLTDSYVPLDALEIAPDRLGGLDLTWRVMRASGGLLLFRRSSVLHGSEALIEFPVLGYLMDESLTRFNHVYED
jgi:signal transduction histidine kinase